MPAVGSFWSIAKNSDDKCAVALTVSLRFWVLRTMLPSLCWPAWVAYVD
jgi:hypothetical protein